MKKKTAWTLIGLLSTSLWISGCSAPEQSKKDTAAPVKTETEKQEKDAAPAAKPVTQYQINPTTFDIERVKADNSSSSKKLALLTFDDAPRNAEVVHQLLDVLEKHHAHAIWFVNGTHLMEKDGTIKPEGAKLLKEIKAKGHIIGNHTYSHQNLKSLTNSGQVAQAKEEITLTNQAVKKITGDTPRYFRHPFGAYSDTSVQLVKEEGMSYMNWSVGSLDWENKDPEKVKQQVLTTAHDGMNILMHDLPQTADMLDSLLTELSKEGYEFVVPTT